MKFRNSVFAAIMILCCAGPLWAQSENTGLKIFGYFQTELQHEEGQNLKTANTFRMQQLNLFLQKDFNEEWTSFINMELVNNYSSERNWGSFNLEEAWVRYRRSHLFNLKLGLLVPEFNHLNTIKNKTPLLPYIVRPIVYETAFNEVIPVEVYVPNRAFVQAYGFVPLQETKLDYALYIGNGADISKNTQENVLSGVDTTTAWLVGGRIGFRNDHLKAGLSATYDRTSEFKPTGEMFNVPVEEFLDIARIRLGGDISYYRNNLLVEGEFISLTFDENHPDIDLVMKFYYGTVGWQFSDRLMVYGSYTTLKSNIKPLLVNKLRFPSYGCAVNLNEWIKFKLQVAPIRITYGGMIVGRQEFNYYSAAVSAMF